TLVCTGIAIFVALTSAKSYTSRQTLVVRDDLVGTSFKPGRFDSFDSLKSAQETILEVSRRPQVVLAALEKVGAPALTSTSSWLSEENVQKVQGKIQLSAPNGAEFGRTEAVILTVQGSSRDRSMQFISYLLDEIDLNLRLLRTDQFDSMQQELQEAANVAEESYLIVAKDLKSFETKIGPDLGTLISLNDSQAGTNSIQIELASLTLEQRNAESDLEEVKKQIQILERVADSPEALLEVPQELLQLQPTLGSLANGLNDAILKYSISKGRFTSQNPKLRTDYRAVVDIKQRIKEKLVRTLDSLIHQKELRQDKFDRITRLVTEKRTRLSELSGMRVTYQTLRQEVDKKRDINGKAQSNLAEIQTLGVSAREVNLLSRVGEPQTEIYPDGPSNKVVVLGGLIAGLMIGIGLVMFVAPIDNPLNANPLPESTSSANAPIEQNTINEPRRRYPPQPKEDFEQDGTTLPAAYSSEHTSATEYTNAPFSSSSPSRASKSISDQIRASRTSQPFKDIRQSDQSSSTAAKPSINPAQKSHQSNENQPETISNEASLVAYLKSVNSPESQPQQPSHDALPSKTEHKDITDHEDLDAGLAKKPEDFEAVYDERSPIDNAISSLEDSGHHHPSSNIYEDDKLSELAKEISSQIVSSKSGTVRLEESEDDGSVFQVPKIDALEDADEPKLIISEVAEIDLTHPASIRNDHSSLEESTTQNRAETESFVLKDDSGGESVLEIQPHDEDNLFEHLAEQLRNQSPSPDGMPNQAEKLDFSNLQLDPEEQSSISLTEKLNQLSQQEELEDENFPLPGTGLSADNTINYEPTSSGGSTTDQSTTGLPLNTSFENSSTAEQAVGNESDPKIIGNEPEQRPAATTVDLRMLKEQLTGNTPQKPSPEISSQYDEQSDNASPEAPTSDIDKSISDLADSIRKMCERKEFDDKDDPNENDT
ncbi:MAG: hypothetical protein AAGA30_11985, partial [Planctomycetota bacterium]